MIFQMPHLGSKQIIKYYYDTKQVNNYKQARKDFHKSFPYEEGLVGLVTKYSNLLVVTDIKEGMLEYARDASKREKN